MEQNFDTRQAIPVHSRLGSALVFHKKIHTYAPHMGSQTGLKSYPNRNGYGKERSMEIHIIPQGMLIPH